MSVKKPQPGTQEASAKTRRRKPSNPKWEMGFATQNNMEAPTCSKCGWSVTPHSDIMRKHEDRCWKEKLQPSVDINPPTSPPPPKRRATA